VAFAVPISIDRYFEGLQEAKEGSSHNYESKLSSHFVALPKMKRGIVLKFAEARVLTFVPFKPFISKPLYP
jgi:hypothetical protein